MSTATTEHFLLKSQGSKVEMFLNDQDEIFVCDTDNEGQFWFTIPKQDWVEMKIFIDNQFASITTE